MLISQQMNIRQNDETKLDQVVNRQYLSPTLAATVNLKLGTDLLMLLCWHFKVAGVCCAVVYMTTHIYLFRHTHQLSRLGEVDYIKKVDPAPSAPRAVLNNATEIYVEDTDVFRWTTSSRPDQALPDYHLSFRLFSVTLTLDSFLP